MADGIPRMTARSFAGAAGCLLVDCVGGCRGDGRVVEQGAVPHHGEFGDLAVLAELERCQDGRITKLTVVWDGSLLDDTTITATAAHALDK